MAGQPTEDPFESFKATLDRFVVYLKSFDCLYTVGQYQYDKQLGQLFRYTRKFPKFIDLCSLGNELCLPYQFDFLLNALNIGQ